MRVRLKTVTLNVAETLDAPVAGSPEAAVPFLRAIFADLDGDREHFLVVAVNSKHRPVGYKVTATGGMAHASVDRRCALRDALLLGAANIIIAHNHPSGDPEPSPDDVVMTRELKEGARAVGLNLLDHIVLGSGDRWASLCKLGLL